MFNPSVLSVLYGVHVISFFSNYNNLQIAFTFPKGSAMLTIKFHWPYILVLC